MADNKCQVVQPDDWLRRYLGMLDMTEFGHPDRVKRRGILRYFAALNMTARLG